MADSSTPAVPGQPESGQPESGQPESGQPESGQPESDSPESGAAKRRKSPVGVPVWRTGKPDAVVAAAVDVAREGVLGIADERQIGAHLGVRSEGERVATHLFECRMPGYVGWQWFAVLTRVSRSKTVTVDEVGLLPSENSVLAPEWVPWADRVRPGDDEEAAELAGILLPESAAAGASAALEQGEAPEQEEALEQDAADAEADTHN